MDGGAKSLYPSRCRRETFRRGSSCVSRTEEGWSQFGFLGAARRSSNRGLVSRCLRWRWERGEGDEGGETLGGREKKGAGSRWRRGWGSMRQSGTTGGGWEAGG